MRKLRSQVERLGRHPTVVIASYEGERVIVSVCVQKVPGEPPILADDLDVRALDVDGQPLLLIEWPRPGALIEVSTMGVTASGRFVFERQPGQEVSDVDVRLRDHRARFQICRGSRLRESKAG